MTAMKPTCSWIVIADGAQARILENHGPGKGLVPLPAKALHKTSRPTRDIGTDRPGRGYNPGGQHHAMDSQSDPHREEKGPLAELLAEFLNAEALAQSYDGLILVSPAKTLEDRHQQRSKEAAARSDGG